MQRTAAKPRRVLMDFAPASAASLDSYSHLGCRLRLLDFPTLRHDLSKAQSPQEYQRLLRQNWPRQSQHPSNLILCWDYLNYLPRGPISLIMEELAAHAQPGALVHMLIAYSNPTMPAQACHFTPQGQDHVLVKPLSEQSCDAPRYAPNDLMRCMPRYKIDKAMLLRNGYQEYILQVRDEEDVNELTNPSKPEATTTRRINTQ